ncbi:Uncharacterized protein FWK35_00001141 [Aphis craccivora]|uniref:Uncharacterized protein n=1 Tax=Aphis craccivora TaxID=307492 RepID=A0A6G0ZPR0_APHCR|nr:Uncharacterized protein FWK35_00001141 [Aphis craccivora]
MLREFQMAIKIAQNEDINLKAKPPDLNHYYYSNLADLNKLYCNYWLVSAVAPTFPLLKIPTGTIVTIYKMHVPILVITVVKDIIYIVHNKLNILYSIVRNEKHFKLNLCQNDRNSERSDECIDFTMMYVFFVSVYSITSRNNAPISNFGGGFRCKSEHPWCIMEIKSKHFTTVF